MVKGLDRFDQLIEELSMLEYDGKKFEPTKVKFAQCYGPGSFKIIKDSTPFKKLRKAYDKKEDVRVADFYGYDIRVGFSFANGMRLYVLGGAGYLREKKPLELLIPLAVLVNR